MTSNKIVACARTWLGTRFQHQGRLKKASTHKGGVDCLGLLIGVARDLRLKDEQGVLLSDYDNVSYSRMPDGEQLNAALLEHLDKVALAGIQPGDIALFEIDNNPQHLGIITDYAAGLHGVIHAYAQARKVVEHALDKDWIAKIKAVYRVPEN